MAVTGMFLTNEAPEGLEAHQLHPTSAANYAACESFSSLLLFSVVKA